VNPFLFIRLCSFAYSLKRTVRIGPALCPRRVLLARVPFDRPLPSTASVAIPSALTVDVSLQESERAHVARPCKRRTPPVLLTSAQLSMLLEGIDWRRVERTAAHGVDSRPPILAAGVRACTCDHNRSV
jgi:hypothetical protein